MRSILLSLLAVGFAGSVAAAAASSLLPPIGASQTFFVSTHTDAPFHRPPGQGPGNGPGGSGSPPSGGPQGGAPGAGPGQFQQFFRDETGTVTFRRATDDSLVVSTTGDLDPVDAPLSVNAQGAVDQGQSPNRFVVAFDNASALATAAASTPAGSATFSALMPNASIATVPLVVKVVSTNGDTTNLEGTGSGSVTIATPHGDRPVDINATADLELRAGRLSTYTQTLVQTIKTPFRSMNITTTTTLKAQ